MRLPDGPTGTAILLVIAVLSVGACSAGESGAAGVTPAVPEVSGEWVLVAMGGPEDPEPVSTERVTTITLTEGELTGAAPCNRYQASYTLDGASLVIGPIAATQALCGDPNLDGQEAAYLRALGTATELTIDGENMLTIAYGPGNQLRYRPA